MFYEKKLLSYELQYIDLTFHVLFISDKNTTKSLLVADENRKMWDDSYHFNKKWFG